MSTEKSLIFYVNGKKVVENEADPETTLLTYLRLKLRLTGTKLGCGEGGCGACTVMLSKYNPTNKKIRHYSANACLTPVCSLHGMAVTTVEGIGSIKNGLHPVQERIAKSHGSQCGFCTPGIVMSMYTLLRNNSLPSTTDMESAFEGNLCRCTGYRPILEGFKTFTKEFCQMGENCCRNKPQNNAACNGKTEEESGVGTELFNSRDFLPLDPTQDPIFPPELQTNKFDTECLTFTGERVQWFRPVSLDQLLDLKSKYPDARMVIGNTEVGLEMKLKNQLYPVIIAPTHIKELNEISELENGYKFGASVTLTEIEHTLKESIKQLPDYKTRVYQAVVEMLRWFAGHQIRNVAAVGGNIMTASPISDLNPIFLACGAVLEVASKGGGTRKVKMDENFFVSYRRTVVKPTEVLLSVFIPYTEQNEYFWAYKQAHRRDDDIAIVNGGMKVVFENNSNVIKDIALAFGGMAPTTVMAVKTMKQVTGRKWEDNLVTDVCNLLKDDLPLDPGAPGGMVEFRRTLTTSFFFKFYLSVQIQLQQKLPSVGTSKVPTSYKSATSVYQSAPSKSTQLYEEVPSGQPDSDPVGRPLTHLSALKQATGEAVYIDDMPRYSNELYLAVVLSTKAHAEIVNVDATKALTMPGVVDFITHANLKHNMWGAVFPNDEEIIASEKVVSVGQIIGAVLADNQDHAQRAAKAVKVEYKELKPIVTIKEAIAEGSFYLPAPTIKYGDIEKGFENSDHTIEGEIHIGGQEHFYLETQATLGVPKNEDGELEMFISTQNPTENQLVIAEALGIDANKVVIRVKRMGGGFGGKETRSNPLSVCVAAAAQKHGRPVRCMLDRNEDMVHTGTRHPFLGKYKVGFKEDGKIQAVDVKLYSNAGYSIDLSKAVMDRAMFHSDNAYKIPNLSVTGYCCKTNTPSNTAFRGFGGPQGMFVAEVWMDDVAKVLGMSPVEVRQKNLYKEGECTHYNQVLDNCTIERCWTECLKQSDYDRRRKDVDIFNSENRWRKKGISIIPVKFGISYTALFLNQAGALVHIYRDGSVLLTHGGTEMGQGLHTKMIQVASRTLHIPASKIHISETSTSTVPNTSPTAASASSDLNGMAVQIACQTLLERLEPYMNANLKGSWDDWVNAAYFDRVSLSATGFYKTPGIGYNPESNSGNPFNYFTSGVACSEVEIDCLTGDHKVLRTDIVMDVGASLNPAIDIGQIEGAFAQVIYNYKIKLEKSSGDPMNSHCECPSGKGPHGTCKHVAAVMLMLQEFVNTGDIEVEKSCTDSLQMFHKPRCLYSGEAVEAEDIPTKKQDTEEFLDDPRPQKYRNMAGYNDFVRNQVTNFCAVTSSNMSFRYLYQKADIQAAVKDHDYCSLPFTEYWVDDAVKGYGMMMLEQQKMSASGFLFTTGPSTYKIPGFGDIPLEFNVSLLKGSLNKRAVCSSKAIGEPPLFLSASVFFAVKDAISSARGDAGHGNMFQLNSPATPENIRMACQDQFTDLFPAPEEGSFTPWFVKM